MMFVAYCVCRIITFVALLCLSLYDVCLLLCLSHYYVCRIILFVAIYVVCRLQGLSQYPPSYPLIPHPFHSLIIPPPSPLIPPL